jgi:hypothetical protein
MNLKETILFLALIGSALAAPRAVAELNANLPYTLNVDIYSGLLPHDGLREQNYEFELRRLRQGYPPTSTFMEFYPRIIRLSHRAEKNFVIGETGQADGEKVVAVARVTTQPDGKLKCYTALVVELW